MEFYDDQKLLVEMNELCVVMQTLKSYEDFIRNPKILAFLRNPSTTRSYQRLHTIFLTNSYIKVKKRMITSLLLRFTQYSILESHGSTKAALLIRETVGLSDLLETRPKLKPIIHREERDRVIHFLENYFKPMLDAVLDDIDEIITRFSSVQIDDDLLSLSDENDLDNELREHPICERCGNLSWRLCNSCKNVSYCSLWCQHLHWSIHKPQCKEKKD